MWGGMARQQSHRPCHSRRAPRLPPVTLVRSGAPPPGRPAAARHARCCGLCAAGGRGARRRRGCGRGAAVSAAQPPCPSLCGCPPPPRPPPGCAAPLQRGGRPRGRRGEEATGVCAESRVTRGERGGGGPRAWGERAASVPPSSRSPRPRRPVGGRVPHPSPVFVPFFTFGWMGAASASVNPPPPPLPARARPAARHYRVGGGRHRRVSPPRGASSRGEKQGNIVLHRCQRWSGSWAPVDWGRRFLLVLGHCGPPAGTHPPGGCEGRSLEPPSRASPVCTGEIGGGGDGRWGGDGCRRERRTRRASTRGSHRLPWPAR